MNPMGFISRLIVHHSASPPAITTVEAIREWHTDPEKVGGPFSDIGYHRIIEADGTLRVGRGLEYQGAHAGADGNGHSIGLCCVGDNTVPEHAWNNVQQATLVEFIEACRNVWPGIVVLGHKDVKPTTECPGVEMADWMAERGI